MIQAISEASQSISYEAMAGCRSSSPRRSCKDPDVESLSSFIGVDGTNQTQNTGRFLINLKPHDERKLTATRDHPPAADGSVRASPASRSTCSRCRI